MPTPTTISLKTSFLRTQIQLLSQPLHLPTARQNTHDNDNDNDTPLRPKAIEDALQKLNDQLRKHNKMVYGPQATRHVAEQIDRLYWNAGERGVDGGGVEGWCEKGVDYASSEIISQLPEQWSEEAAEKAPESAARYTALQRRLKDLDERRRVAREKVAGYRRMKALLALIDAEGDVQGNLVTKNGDVETEMERMRMLMLRVERGVGGLEKKIMEDDEEGDEDDMDVDWEEEGERKIQDILAMM